MLVSMSTIIHQPHDKLFKLALGEVVVAKAFFTTYLPGYILKLIDLSTLHLDNSTFIIDLFKNHNSDVVYKVKLKKDSRDLFLLCEHLSTIDPKTALRLCHYQLAIVEGYIKQYPKQSMPRTYSLIYYTGNTPWIAPLEIFPQWMDLCN